VHHDVIVLGAGLAGLSCARDDIWELTWAADGRATWQYGPEQRPGEPHVIWRRIGGHEIFKRP
jgi:anaerobic glycerol-3-phosphate dehydrogenase